MQLNGKLHTSGSQIDVGLLIFESPRVGPTLWQIGVPDRSAAEFFIPEPNPKYGNKLYMNSEKLVAFCFNLKPRFVNFYFTSQNLEKSKLILPEQGSKL
jgi:Polysaccharide lyase family 4, domain III